MWPKKLLCNVLDFATLNAGVASAGPGEPDNCGVQLQTHLNKLIQVWELLDSYMQVSFYQGWSKTLEDCGYTNFTAQHLDCMAIWDGVVYPRDIIL